MDDSDRSYTTLLHMVESLRAQIALTARDDPRRDNLYRDLLGCYQELFAILRRRFDACHSDRKPPA